MTECYDRIPVSWPMLDVGSFNVNGSNRRRNRRVVGVDVRRGPGVDVQASADALPFADRSWSVACCTETLEHVEHWRETLADITRVLRPGGYLILTTRSPGAGHHDHPGDWWRFPTGFLDRHLQELGYRILDSRQDPTPYGVFLLAQSEHTPIRASSPSEPEKAPPAGVGDHYV